MHWLSLELNSLNENELSLTKYQIFLVITTPIFLHTNIKFGYCGNIYVGGLNAFQKLRKS